MRTGDRRRRSLGAGTLWHMLDLPDDGAGEGARRERLRAPDVDVLVSGGGNARRRAHLPDHERRPDAAGDPRRHRRPVDRRRRRLARDARSSGVSTTSPTSISAACRAGRCPGWWSSPPTTWLSTRTDRESTEYVVGPDFERMWTSALAHCHKRFEGKRGALPQDAVRRDRRVHARQLPGLRRLPPERLRDRGLEPRLQDDRHRARSWRKR